MKRTMLYSKIHNAIITETNINYVGSISIDEKLMIEANILPNEQVHLWNINRGTRLITYAIPHTFGSGFICVNGSAVHGNKPDDRIIIATFTELSKDEIRGHIPRVITVKNSNLKWEEVSGEKEEEERECL